MTEIMDNSLSAASILATVGDVNHWTVARFIVDELYTTDDDAAKSVSVDLVKWFNRDGNKMDSSVANKVNCFEIFDPTHFSKLCSNYVELFELICLLVVEPMRQTCLVFL
jgi:hypothetical protein